MYHFPLLLLFVYLTPSPSTATPIQCTNIKELDSQNSKNYCSERHVTKTLSAGDTCLLSPERVHPTQVFVGKVEMECTKRDMETRNSSSLRHLVLENPVPTVVGPGGNFFIVDHHHFAVALYEAFLQFKEPNVHRVLYACIQEDYSALDTPTFWQRMIADKNVFLEDEYGVNITIHQLPSDLKSMADNPYRTLASWLRKSNAWIKCGTKKKTKHLEQCKEHPTPFFIECYWANFMRRKFPVVDFPSYPVVKPPLENFIYRAALQLQVEALVSVLHKAVKAATNPEASWMPGYNMAQKIMPPEAIDVDSAGCAPE